MRLCCGSHLPEASNVVPASRLQTMCCDYGFRSNSGRMYQEGYGQIPDSAFKLVSRYHRLSSAQGPCGRCRQCSSSKLMCTGVQVALCRSTPWLLLGKGVDSSRIGPPPVLVADVSAAAQAANNFKQEWMQLRRSFRFNEYGKISKLNPPQGPIGKVRRAVAALVLSCWRCVVWVAHVSSFMVAVLWTCCMAAGSGLFLANLLSNACFLLSSTHSGSWQLWGLPPSPAQQRGTNCRVPLMLQVTYGLGSAVVNVFARVDEFLETKRWFTTLVPPPIPSEVFDASTGSMKGECRQVRTPGVCAPGHTNPLIAQRGLSCSWGQPDMPAAQHCRSVNQRMPRCKAVKARARFAVRTQCCCCRSGTS